MNLWVPWAVRPPLRLHRLSPITRSNKGGQAAHGTQLDDLSGTEQQHGSAGYFRRVSWREPPQPGNLKVVLRLSCFRTDGAELVESKQRSQFERCALASGLLRAEQLDQGRAALRQGNIESPGDDGQPDDRQLAEVLVEMDRLNPWQAAQLLEGRSKFNLGAHLIVDSLGKGGMGQVFMARHSVLGRTAAIKVLPRDRCTPEAIANFTREIRAQAKLDHPNLVRALDAGTDGNVYYLVTEYVPGTDLHKLVRGHGPLSVHAAASIVSQTAEALEYAHRQGLIHRDVKPGNVLVTPEGIAKLSDLGLSGPLAGDAENDPRFGKIVGTADYLSPDHIESPWEPTPAWDIYSLGCTLYYAVTGKVPFPGGSTRDKARAHCNLRPLDPRRLNSKLDPRFVEVMADMMAKDPAERISTAAKVVARLAPWAGDPMPLALAEREAGMASAAEVPADESDLEETESSFPEMPELRSGGKDASNPVSQPTGSAAWDTGATSSVPEISPLESARPRPIITILVILLLFPVAIAAAVALTWWILRLAS